MFTTSILVSFVVITVGLSTTRSGFCRRFQQTSDSTESFISCVSHILAEYLVLSGCLGEEAVPWIFTNYKHHLWLW